MKSRKAIAFLALGLVVLGGILLYTYHEAGPGGDRERHAVSPRAEGDAAAATPPPAGGTTDYSPIWETFAPPTSAQPAPVVKKPEIKFRLRGILLQETRPVAVIEDSAGRQRLVPQGGSVDGAKVTKISPTGITVEIGGEQMTLPLKTEQKTPPGPKPSAAPPKPR